MQDFIRKGLDPITNVKRPARLVAALLCICLLFSSCSLKSLFGGWWNQNSHEDVSFEDMTYTRPDADALIAQIEKATMDFDGATSAENQMEIFNSFSEESTHFSSMYTLAELHTYLDGTDEFYQEEMDYLNQKQAEIQAKRTTLNQKLLASPYREELEKAFGRWQFDDLELMAKTSSESVASLKARENQLITTYNMTVATATIDYFGEEKLYSSLEPDIQYYMGPVYYEKYNPILGGIFLELFELRQEMAQTLGYDNYISYAYDNRGRSCYNKEDVEKLQNDVKAYFVPLYTSLIDGAYEDMAQGNVSDNFLLNTPAPVGGFDEMVETFFATMDRMSRDTQKSIRFMQKNSLYDFKSRENKSNLGFTVNIPGYESPYMYTSLDGNSYYDVVTLCHEFGHYNSMYHKISPTSEYASESRTTDVAEIYSQGMEFLAFPYYDDFFGSGAEIAQKRVVFSQMEGSINTTLQEEFQNRIYQKQSITLTEFNEIYSELCVEYGLISAEEADAVNFGQHWIDIPHFFLAPFYSIDYTVSSCAALQIWEKVNEDWKDGYQTYEKLLYAPPSLDFLEVLAEGELKSPFEEGNLRVLSEKIDAFLAS